MRKNTKILIISFVAACILFLVLTVIQNRLTQQEIKTTVFVAKADLAVDTELSREMFEEIKVPVSLTLNREVVIEGDTIAGKFVQNPIFQGQILFSPDIAVRKKLYQTEMTAGEEKVAIKLKASENSVSYQVKPEMRIHLYFTARYGAVEDILQTYGLQSDAFQENSLYTVKLLENEEVLGVFDEAGESIFSERFTKPDTIVLGVEPNMARLINNLRSQGIFDITI
ncbi:MAG: SAF domain-containing protein [Clostridia bacterium]|nr:SAF domain-containing protein [Clostridia bacterium]